MNHDFFLYPYMSARYLDKTYGELAKAYLPSAFTEPCKNLEEQINKDLPRQNIFIIEDQKLAPYTKANCNHAAFSKYYSQGDLNASIFAKNMLLENQISQDQMEEFTKASADDFDKIIQKYDEKRKNKAKQIEFGFYDDNNVPCGLTISYHPNDPGKWQLTFIQNTQAEPHERKVIIIYDHEDLPSLDKLAIEATPSQKPPQCFEMLNSKIIEKLLKGTFNQVGNAQIEALRDLDNILNLYLTKPCKIGLLNYALDTDIGVLCDWRKLCEERVRLSKEINEALEQQTLSKEEIASKVMRLEKVIEEEKLFFVEKKLEYSQNANMSGKLTSFNEQLKTYQTKLSPSPLQPKKTDNMERILKRQERNAKIFQAAFSIAAKITLGIFLTAIVAFTGGFGLIAALPFIAQIGVAVGTGLVAGLVSHFSINKLLASDKPAAAPEVSGIVKHEAVPKPAEPNSAVSASLAGLGGSRPSSPEEKSPGNSGTSTPIGDPLVKASPSASKPEDPKIIKGP